MSSKSASRYDDLAPEESHAFRRHRTHHCEQESESESQKVVLMTTLHSAKWLEFEHVIIGEQKKGFSHILVHSLNRTNWKKRGDSGVAMTRAKTTRHHQSKWAIQFGTYSSNIESRFVGEIPKRIYTDTYTEKTLYDRLSQHIQWTRPQGMTGQAPQHLSRKLGLGAQVRQNPNRRFCSWWSGNIKNLVSVLSYLSWDVAQIAFEMG